ncbi:MAG: CAP domain-containing protein [Lachnospiraceae bacterium]|nr:CAP domain-containing protein [Lachnospiraceae bacterium]
MKQKLRKWLFVLAAACLMVSMGTLTVFAENDSDVSDDNTTTVELTVTYGQTEARIMLDMINTFRTGDDAWYWNSDDTTTTTCTGLSELVYDYTLEKVAMQRAAEIALSYSHTRPNNEGCETALYVYYTLGTDLYAYGENIAAGYNKLTTAAAAFEAWQETDEDYSGQGHRRNMLSKNFTAVGIAHVTYGNCEYWVQVFGTPTTVNTTATTANDSEATVTIEVSNASVKSVTLTASSASYNLSCGDSEELPTATANLTMEDTWPSGATRKVTVVSPTWSSDTSIVTIDSDSGKVIAATAGSANLTVSALGKDVSTSVTVSHSTTEIKDAKAATCTEAGYTGDTICSVCKEIVTAGEVLPATGHTAGEAVEENKVAVACTKAGSYDSVVYCSVCGEELSRETVTVPATGHSTEIQNAKDATCTEDGYTGDEARTVCGETVATGEEVPATGHTEAEAVVENEVAATCTEAGSYDSVVYCSVCDAVLSRETIAVAATGHTAGGAVVENEVAATHTTAGSYESAVYCSVCGEELSRETITVPAGGHTAGDPVIEKEVDPTCTEDGSYDTVVYCTECSEEISRETITVPATGHTPAEAVDENHVAATCIAAGSYDSVIYCSVCGAEINRGTVTVPATGIHTYVLDEDASTAATCIAGGENVYVCSGCGDSYSVTVDATGHHYEAAEVVEPTYAAQGYTVYTCSGCGESYRADYTDILVLDETDTSLDVQQKVQSLTAVPEGLTSLYSSVEALKEALISQVVVTQGYTEENTAVYDVVLQYRVNGGAWVDATEDNFPTSGITVTLSYPDGTDSSYDFIVMHMFTVTSQRLGTVAGKTEFPAVTKTENGLVVNLTGLSPVVIAWKESTTTQNSAEEEETTVSSAEVEETASSSNDVEETVTSSDGTTAAVTVASADTGDEANLALWAVLLLIACGGLTTAVICIRRKQNEIIR